MLWLKHFIHRLSLYAIILLLFQNLSLNGNPNISPSTLEDYYSYSKGGAKERFENKFKKICLKYNFVEKYVNMLLNNPSGNYMIFVFHENGKHNHGGLGDRLAGMITATAYAIRSNRTLLIQGDKAFEDSFRPYFPSDFKPILVSNNTTVHDISLSPSHHHHRHTISASLYPTWKSWDWSGWKHTYSINMTKLHCINPVPEATHCALDKIKTFRSSRVLKYYGNRVYLCRWCVHPKLKDLLSDELYATLGIDNNDLSSSSSSNMNSRHNLYEVAGCLLRLAIWPTDKLWKALDETMVHQFIHRPQPAITTREVDDNNQHLKGPNRNNRLSGGQGQGARTEKQIGFHFRCGDSSFSASDNPSHSSSISIHKYNPECYYESEKTWHGTSFSDDRATDSPIDHAMCGRSILAAITAAGVAHTTYPQHQQQHEDGSSSSSSSSGLISNSSGERNSYVLAYIASDNKDSSDQINSTLRWGYTVKPPQSCHMDIQRNAHCTLSTSLQWFMLSLSDIIITQALIKPKPSVYDDIDIKYSEAAPVSAFSRYASIYALAADSIRYGRGCRQANQTRLSYESHGNWVCNPHMFY